MRFMLIVSKTLLFRLSSASLLMCVILGGGVAARAQDDTSLSPSLSNGLSDPLTSETPTAGFSSEIVSGASSLAPTTRRGGISDPTGALLENSVRTPNVSAGVDSDPAQQFVPDINVDSARTSLVNGYLGSRAAFQPAFSGTQMRSFNSSPRVGAQAAAGARNYQGLQSLASVSGSAFGRGSQQLQAFGSTGAQGANPDDASGLPVIYTDPSLIQTSTLVTSVGTLAGQTSSPQPGTPMAILSSDNYAGLGHFSDSTRGTAGSPPDISEGSPPLLSPTGQGESPFRSLSLPGSSFLQPSLVASTPARVLPLSREALAHSPAARKARMQAMMSGVSQSPVPAFEQKRLDRLRNAQARPGERQSRVVLSSKQPQQ